MLNISVSISMQRKKAQDELDLLAAGGERGFSMKSEDSVSFSGFLAHTNKIVS